MNYNTILMDYIDNCPFDEPILIEEIKQYIKDNIDEKDNIDHVLKNLYVYINRLVKRKKIIQFLKGICYKPKDGVFGKKKLNIGKVRTKKYLEDDNGIKGYFTGPYLLNKLGLTTQVSRYVYIVTNECPNENIYKNEKLGVVIRKPKININEENYKYLQLLDILNNKDKVNIEVDKNKEKEIIYKFIDKNKLEYKKIFELAKATKNKKAIEKLYELG